MDRRLACAVLALAFTLDAAAKPSLRSENNGWVFGDEALAVVIGGDGFFKEARSDGRTALRTAPDDTPFDLDDGTGWLWPRIAGKTRCKGIERLGENEVCSRVLAGPWQIDFHYKLLSEKRMICRKVVLGRTMDEEGEYHGFRLAGGRWNCGTQGGYVPSFRCPPVERLAPEFEAGREEDAWIAASPVVADDGEGRSVIWAHDWTTPYGEETPCSVTEIGIGGEIRMLFKFSRSCGYVRRHEPQTLGDVWCWFREGDRESTMRALPEWYAVVGQRAVPDRPEWVAKTKLYCLHPGGTIESGNRDWGGFAAAAAKLDFIAAMGCNAVWLRPVEDIAPYQPRDYYRLQDGIGTEEDFRRFVAHAHDLGLRVLADIVPHGGFNDNDRAKEHPEWLVRDQKGNALRYWCFDQLSPTWQDYMANVADFYMRRYGLDGLRIDSANGSKTANWTRGVPYARASLSQEQGGLAMTRAIRRAVKSANPDGATLAEARANLYTTVSDAVYDMDMAYKAFPPFAEQPPAEAVRALRHWLHDLELMQVPGTVSLRYVESHDTITTAPLYGSRAQVALFAVSAFVPGIVMVMQDRENGRFYAYRDILRTRAALPELETGEADFLGIEAPDGVFACLRTLGDAASVVLVNFNETTVDGDISVPESAARGARHLMDALTDETLPLVDGRCHVHLTPLAWRVLRVGDEACWDVFKARRQESERFVETSASPTFRVVSRTDTELVLAADNMEGWFADTAEGRLANPFEVRHPHFDGIVGEFLYDEVGNALLFDSKRIPFGFDDAHATVGVFADGRAWGLVGLQGRRIRLFDRIGDDHGLKIAIDINPDEDVTALFCPCPLGPFDPFFGGDGGTGDSRLRQIVGGWVFEEGRLRVRFARNGAIVGVWRQDNAGTWSEVVRNAQIVSRRGYNWKHAPRGGEQRLDLEPDISLRRFADGTLECSFAGHLRGAGRTGKLKQPVHYATSLRFNGDHGFDIACASRAEADSIDPDADLSFRVDNLAPGIDMPSVEWAENGRVTAGEKRGFSRRVEIGTTP